MIKYGYNVQKFKLFYIIKTKNKSFFIFPLKIQIFLSIDPVKYSTFYSDKLNYEINLLNIK